jgi:hypothetical protein
MELLKFDEINIISGFKILEQVLKKKFLKIFGINFIEQILIKNDFE